MYMFTYGQLQQFTVLLCDKKVTVPANVYNDELGVLKSSGLLT